MRGSWRILNICPSRSLNCSSPVLRICSAPATIVRNLKQVKGRPLNPQARLREQRRPAARQPDEESDGEQHGQQHHQAEGCDDPFQESLHLAANATVGGLSDLEQRQRSGGADDHPVGHDVAQIGGDEDPDAGVLQVHDSWRSASPSRDGPGTKTTMSMSCSSTTLLASSGMSSRSSPKLLAATSVSGVHAPTTWSPRRGSMLSRPRLRPPHAPRRR